MQIWENPMRHLHGATRRRSKFGLHAIGRVLRYNNVARIGPRARQRHIHETEGHVGAPA